MGETDPLIQYRVEQLEEAVEKISLSMESMNTAINDFKLFAAEIRTWMKAVAAIWSIMVLVIAGIGINLIIG